MELNSAYKARYYLEVQMKSFIITLAFLAVANVEARSLLTFKPALTCQSIKKYDALFVQVLVSQDNQAKLIIKKPLESGQDAIAYGRKLTAGANTKFVATNEITKERVNLAVSSLPTKLGSHYGKMAKIELEKEDAIDLICSVAN